jgi:hypothetical protein
MKNILETIAEVFTLVIVFIAIITALAVFQ